MRRILYAVFYPVIWLGNVIGQVLRILLFPFIWQYEHSEELMMFCLKILGVLFAILATSCVVCLIACFVFGPFDAETGGHILGWLIVAGTTFAAICVGSRLLDWLHSLGQPK